jgi:hypothetical protein
MAEGAISLTECWRNFNIGQATENIYESWQEVTDKAVTEEISVTTKELGFEDVHSPSVRKCLDPHS